MVRQISSNGISLMFDRQHLMPTTRRDDHPNPGCLFPWRQKRRDRRIVHIRNDRKRNLRIICRRRHVLDRVFLRRRLAFRSRRRAIPQRHRRRQRGSPARASRTKAPESPPIPPPSFDCISSLPGIISACRRIGEIPRRSLSVSSEGSAWASQPESPYR